MQRGWVKRGGCGGGVRRRWRREESKSCLKGFTQRVSADCLQLPSAPPVVSLATVFPNLSTASLLLPFTPPTPNLHLSPPSQNTLLMRLRASIVCFLLFFLQLLDLRRWYSFRVHVSAMFRHVCQPLQKPEPRLFEDTAAPPSSLQGFKDFFSRFQNVP